MNIHQSRQEAVRTAAEVLKAGLTELSEDRTRQIRRRLADLYGNPWWSEDEKDKWDHFFSNNGVDYEVVGDFKAWKWIEEFLDGREVLLLFDYRQGEPVYQIMQGRQVVSIIARIWRFVGQNFYVTDTSNSFLFGYRTDGYLYAVAGAKDWLHHLKLGAIYQMLNLPERPLHVTRMDVLEWGSQFVFHCLYDPQGEQKPFKLVFDETYDIELDTSKKSLRTDTAPIEHIHLYQANPTEKDVVFSSYNVWVQMRYKQLILEREW